MDTVTVVWIVERTDGDDESGIVPGSNCDTRAEAERLAQRLRHEQPRAVFEVSALRWSRHD